MFNALLILSGLVAAVLFLLPSIASSLPIAPAAEIGIRFKDTPSLLSLTTNGTLAPAQSSAIAQALEDTEFPLSLPIFPRDSSKMQRVGRSRDVVQRSPLHLTPEEAQSLRGGEA
ncbi:hypothetical protein QCA50_016118 [Cerrena zonata]|uniref:Uncharacterized protein n=1 Tax=Cerrena zonata TaxID=2478898 RepID=A0AAW0FTE0_9APHY